MKRFAKICTLALTVLLAGCATFQNTPRQDYVWEMGRACQRENADWRLTRVEPSGRYWIQAGDASGVGAFHACMQRQYQAQPYLGWLKAHAGSYRPAE